MVLVGTCQLGVRLERRAAWMASFVVQLHVAVAAAVGRMEHPGTAKSVANGEWRAGAALSRWLCCVVACPQGLFNLSAIATTPHA